MINLNVPLNPTSLGQTAYNIFVEMAKLDEVAVIPIGNMDLSCFDVSEEDGAILKEAIHRGAYEFDRSAPTVKLWHIMGLREAVGERPHAMTFHETSSLTPFEARTLNSLSKTFVSSKYTKEVFETLVPEHKLVYCPLGFDAASFNVLDEPKDEVIVFGLRGKLESRKHTLRIINAWSRHFGGDPRYRLDCSIFNSFYPHEEQSEMIISAFPNREKPFNVNILPHYSKNAIYNQCLNAADIDLTGMSGCEGFNLPLFQSLCLGKQAVVLDAHVHKDYCNQGNSHLVKPKGMVQAADGKFFFPGSETNQGDWFDFDDDEFIATMETATKKAKEINYAGMSLADEFTFARTAKIIHDNIT